MDEREPLKTWVKQCDAAEQIRADLGLENALAYLVGEKYLAFLRESDRRPELAADLPDFTRRVREIFEPCEIAGLLDAALRRDAAEEDPDWPFDDLRDARVEPLDVILEAERILLLERAREHLLGTPPG